MAGVAAANSRRQLGHGARRNRPGPGLILRILPLRPLPISIALDERTTADEEEFTDEVRARVESYLLGAKRQEALIAYMAELRDRAERNGQIRVNESTVGSDSSSSDEPEQSASR